MKEQYSNTLISIVSPVYAAEKIIDLLIERIIIEVSKITDNFEIILVEDGSQDNSWQKIEQNCKEDNRVKGIKLSRNFGQHYAITAGLEYAKGEWIIVMDCDLQDLPEEIANLYNKAQEGYDIVLASREQRRDSCLKCFFSWVFYKILSYLSGTNYDSSIGNFGIYHSKVIGAICRMKENIRIFAIMIQWIGFKQTKIKVQHGKRIEGKTTYNFTRLFNLALDTILSYSDKPIRLTIKFGFIISLLAFISAFVIILKYLEGKITVLGYASLIVSIVFFSGLIMMTLGIIGLYIGKIFESVKNRPLYLVDKEIL